jgi:hypothetical protein
MSEQSGTPKEKTFTLLNHVDYADGSVVSRTLLKRQSGNVTLPLSQTGTDTCTR